MARVCGHHTADVHKTQVKKMLAMAEDAVADHREWFVGDIRDLEPHVAMSAGDVWGSALPWALSWDTMIESCLDSTRSPW